MKDPVEMWVFFYGGKTYFRIERDSIDAWKEKFDEHMASVPEPGKTIVNIYKEKDFSFKVAGIIGYQVCEIQKHSGEEIYGLQKQFMREAIKHMKEGDQWKDEE